MPGRIAPRRFLAQWPLDPDGHIAEARRVAAGELVDMLRQLHVRATGAIDWRVL